MRYKQFIKQYPSLYLWSQDNKSKLRYIYKHMPYEYILNSTSLTDLYINRDVLIPREETLQLISIANDLIKEHNILRVVDVGGGSGFIGISLLKQNDIHVDFVDKSKKALKVIARNLKNQGFKFNLIENDLLQNYTSEVDLVVANLPYIPSRKIRSLPLGVRRYEPSMALDGGRDGLVYIRRLIEQISNLKVRFCLVEIYEDHELALIKVIKQYSFKSYCFTKDIYDNTRFLLIEI